jgi:hypothetical protein
MFKPTARERLPRITQNKSKADFLTSKPKLPFYGAIKGGILAGVVPGSTQTAPYVSSTSRPSSIMTATKSFLVQPLQCCTEHPDAPKRTPPRTSSGDKGQGARQPA